jgi:hypothetical protein
LVRAAAGRGRDIKIKTRHINSNSRWRAGWLADRAIEQKENPARQPACIKNIYNKSARENCLPLKQVFFLAAFVR